MSETVAETGVNVNMRVASDDEVKMTPTVTAVDETGAEDGGRAEQHCQHY